MQRQAQKAAQKLLYKHLRYLPRNRPWVFGIGLSKTGTSSLTDALDVLGYRAMHMPPLARVDREGVIHMEWPWWLSRFDCATDLSVAVLFRELRATFPRARFIYTWRDEESWLSSCERHFSVELAAKRLEQKNSYMLELCQAFYGHFLFDETKYLAAYRTHEAAVLETFRDDPAFLSYGLIQNAGWGPLCQFLGKPVPEVLFPFSNRGRPKPRGPV